jgi:hypothetical protein
MTIDVWWPGLGAETREWLMGNNGDAVPTAVIEEVARVGGPPASDAWWVREDDSPGPRMPDAAIDWIEAKANEETTEL